MNAEAIYRTYLRLNKDNVLYHRVQKSFSELIPNLWNIALGFIEMNRLRRLRLAGIFVIWMNLFIHFRRKVKNNTNKQIPFFIMVPWVVLLRCCKCMMNPVLNLCISSTLRNLCISKSLLTQHVLRRTYIVSSGMGKKKKTSFQPAKG